VLYLLFDHLLHGQAYAYKSVLFRSACAIILSFVIVWWFGPAFIRMLLRLKLRDVPEFDHKALNELTRDNADTPSMGGVLILAAILASVLLLADLGNYYVRMGVVCLVWLGLLGATDDWLKLTATASRCTRSSSFRSHSASCSVTSSTATGRRIARISPRS
jgi:phospho-N-acetylmuramoyl-pentapeptide-transferase